MDNPWDVRPGASRGESDSKSIYVEVGLPSFFNPKKYGLDEKVSFQYVAADIIYYRQEFTKLFLRIQALCRSSVRITRIYRLKNATRAKVYN
jgi:hypothetical protein